nr:interferon-related developmental regulator 1 [Ipomoea trifida]
MDTLLFDSITVKNNDDIIINNLLPRSPFVQSQPSDSQFPIISQPWSSQRKNAAMLDSSDTDSVSSSSTARSEMLVSSGEEVQLDKDTFLDQCLDALYEKRGATREKALASLIDVFNSNMQHEYVEKKFATLLHQCLNSIKKGSSREIALASHFIGLLALTTGSGSKAQEILEESITPISEALKSREEPEETEKSMQLMWQIIHPKMGPNVSSAKPSSPIITAVVSAWTFLLTTMNGWTLNPKSWQESISYFSSLLDKDDRSVRIAAGEALALIFEVGNLEKFAGEAKGSGDGSTDEGSKSRELVHIQGLRSKVLNQVRSLSIEAGGKGSAKKDLNSQRNTFRDIQEFLEYGYSPETSMKIAGESLDTTKWGELIQLNFLKHFLGGGFVKHMQENEFLQDVFSFTPKKKIFSGAEHRVSGTEKDRNVGYYTAGDEA